MQGDILKTLIHALLAIFGAIARQLNAMQKEPLRPALFISGCVIASFMGVIFFFIAAYFSLPDSIAYAAAGICGWIGPNAMDKIIQIVMRALGVKVDSVLTKDDEKPKGGE